MIFFNGQSGGQEHQNFEFLFAQAFHQAVIALLYPL
jgi:hypothetical protein